MIKCLTLTLVMSKYVDSQVPFVRPVLEFHTVLKHGAFAGLWHGCMQLAINAMSSILDNSGNVSALLQKERDL